MRQKELRTIITFYTTAEAMAMEKLCKTREIPGKLISAPRQISADCGIAWSSEVCFKDQLEEAMKQDGLEVAGIYELYM